MLQMKIIRFTAQDVITASVTTPAVQQPNGSGLPNPGVGGGSGRPGTPPVGPNP